MHVNKPASLQPVTIGETMDFEFKPGVAGDYLFEVKDYKKDVVVSKQFKVH